MTVDFCRRMLRVGAALAALLAIIAPASPASAHASLLSAAPADGVTILEPPKSFRLEFNEPVSPLVMRLVRPDGQITALTDVRAENKSVTITTPPMPQLGSYALSWRVISADGHPVGGVVGFAVGHSTVGVGVPPVAGATAVHVAIWIAQFILSLGLFVGVGGAGFAAWLIDKRPMPRCSIFAAVIIGGMVAALASLPFQGLDALAEPLTQVWRPSVWAAGFGTSWGSAVMLALATLAAGLLALWAKKLTVARLMAAMAVLGIGFVFIASGHASTTDPLLTVPSVFLHAVCITLWVGSLLPLTIVLRSGDRVALQRFSRLIPVPLAVLIATGIVLTISGFDRFDALWTTDYGLVLAAKLGLVLLILALAALNRYALVPQLAVSGERRLVMVIATEFVLAAVILGIVGLWRFTPPPRALAAAETTYIHFHGERAMAQIDLTPERDRGASVVIDITDNDNAPVAAKEVVLVIENPSAGIEPIRRNASFEGAEWRISGLHIPVAGVWRMRVEILVGDFDKIMLEDNVELPRAP